MLWEHEPLASVKQRFLVLLNFYWTIHYCAKVMQTPVDEIRKNSSFSTNSWPKRNFHDISANFRGMYCFERLELLATCSLMALMRLEISSENSFYVANISGENSLVLFILSKRFGWICGSVLLYVKLPWNFPPTIWVSTRLMLFATMVKLSVSIVSMRLGSFTYSTLGSHRC